MNKIPLVVILGPTASGKTALAVRLAKTVGGEIVSADSMQVYRGTDILSAKPTKEELTTVPHHLIDILEPNEEFSVAKYSQLAHKAIADIYERGKLPFLVGGTGLYIDAVCDDIVYSDIDSDDNLRKEMLDIAEKDGNDVLYGMLKEKDPLAAARIHPNNVKRVIRALEVMEITGKSILAHEAASKPKMSRYAPLYIGLTAERQILYERIEKRVDMMMDDGLFDEARTLYNVLSSFPDATSAQAIGYKEFVPVIEGKMTLEEAVSTLKIGTRRYAKRQLTWFRRNDKIRWISITENQDELCLSWIREVWNK